MKGRQENYRLFGRSVGPTPYRLSDLKAVAVYSRIWRCSSCGFEETEEAAGFDRAMALAIVRKRSRLRAAEFYYLRAECLRWTGTQLAHRLGMSNVTISRMEHEAQAIMPAVDRALRLMAALAFEFTRDEFAVEMLDKIAPKADEAELLKVRAFGGTWRAVLE